MKVFVFFCCFLCQGFRLKIEQCCYNFVMNVFFDFQFDFFKVFLYFIEVEQLVFGGLLLDNVVWDCIVDFINEYDFYCYDYWLIFYNIGKLILQVKFVDVIMVYEQLQVVGKVEEVGGLVYLNVLVQNMLSVVNICCYVEIVCDCGVLC